MIIYYQATDQKRETPDRDGVSRQDEAMPSEDRLISILEMCLITEIVNCYLHHNVHGGREDVWKVN